MNFTVACRWDAGRHFRSDSTYSLSGAFKAVWVKCGIIYPGFATVCSPSQFLRRGCPLPAVAQGLAGLSLHHTCSSLKTSSAARLLRRSHSKNVQKRVRTVCVGPDSTADWHHSFLRQLCNENMQRAYLWLGGLFFVKSTRPFAQTFKCQASAEGPLSATEPSDSPTVTKKVFFDIKQGSNDLGRVTIGLYGKVLPFLSWSWS